MLRARIQHCLLFGFRKEEVHAEATKALRGVISPGETSSDDKMDTNDERLMPPFIDMVNYIQDKVCVQVNTMLTKTCKVLIFELKMLQAQERLKSSQRYVLGNNILPFNPATYGEVSIVVHLWSNMENWFEVMWLLLYYE